MTTQYILREKKPGYRAFDADRHVMEPPEVWRDYVSRHVYEQYPVRLQARNLEEMSELAPYPSLDISQPLPPIYVIGNEPILANWTLPVQVASASKGARSAEQRTNAMSPQGQLYSMDKDGIHQAALLPTFASYIVNHGNIPAQVSLAYAGAYNRWIKDYCAINRQRLHPVGMVSRHHPHNMVEQLEFLVSEGFTTVVLRPEIILNRSLSHHDYSKFWQACCHHNVAVAFHGGTNLQGATAGSERYQSRFALHACSHPMEAQMAFLSLLDSGILERNPTLRIALLEAGASWVPHWLWRLDNICHPEFPALTQTHMPLKPSDYFKRHVWVAIEPGEPGLRTVIETIGSSKLLFGTDFPHPDHVDFDFSDAEKNYSELTPDELCALFETNPNQFYRTGT